MAKVVVRRKSKNKVILVLSEKEASVLEALVGASNGVDELERIYDALDNAAYKFTYYDVIVSNGLPEVRKS